MATVVKDVRHILHEHCKRLECVDIFQVFLVKLCPWIMHKRLGMSLNFPQLGPANPRERLTGRTADNDVEGLPNAPDVKERAQVDWIGLRNVNWPAMGLGPPVEVKAVGFRRFRIKFDGTTYFKAGRLKTK
ncbi:hypothetical protein WT71_34125 [Burkholderia stagnalis]|nr:hypothetical protein WT71_34125 [Burkholderia stagnalis]KWI76840.1 hypothetical protein WT73_05635 [Burkholderia stagnalis]